MEIIKDDMGSTSENVGNRSIHASLKQSKICLFASLFVDIHRHGWKQSIVFKAVQVLYSLWRRVMTINSDDGDVFSLPKYDRGAVL